MRHEQKGWNQMRVHGALCCDRLKVTSQLLSIQSLNLSSHRVWFLVLGKLKREVGKFWRSLLFNHFWGSCSCPRPVLGETAISSCCCFWNSPKWKTMKGFLFQFVFKTRPITQQSNTYWVLFLISTFLVMSLLQGSVHSSTEIPAQHCNGWIFPPRGRAHSTVKHSKVAQITCLWVCLAAKLKVISKMSVIWL